MICKYSECEEDAGSNRNGKERNYCNNAHRKLGRAEIQQKGYKATMYLTDLDREDMFESTRLLESALKGDVESQEVLKERGLTGHYSRDKGGWGSLTYEGSLE